MSEGIDFSYFKSLIHTWISSQMGEVPVIWAEQTGPAPDELYVTLKILNRSAIGNDYIAPPDPVSGYGHKRGDREITLSIQALGEDSYQALADLEEAFRVPLVYESLETQGIVFIDTHGLSDITSLFGSFREERALLDVRLRVAVPFRETPPEPCGVETGVIEKTTIEGEIEDHELTINVET